mgnify:CR=1 FL=1
MTDRAAQLIERGRGYLADGAFEVAATFFAAGADAGLTESIDDLLATRHAALTSYGGCDVVVLAGGGSTRWGSGNKLEAMLRGHSLLDWAAVGAAISPHPIIVGREHGGGPLAALGAVANRLSAPLTWVVAGDQPLVVGAAAAVRSRLLALPPRFAAVIATTIAPPRGRHEGRRNTTGVLWRTDHLRRQLERAGIAGPLLNRSAQELYNDCLTGDVVVDSLLTHDCDAPADLRLVEQQLTMADLGNCPVPHPYA